MKEVNLPNLAHLLKQNNIPHSYGKEEKLAGIDTSKYTIEELHKMVGGSYRVLRAFLYEKKLPFKNKRIRQDKSIFDAILKQLNGVDTSQHTARELYDFVGENLEFKNFIKFVHQRKVPHKSDQTRATAVPKLKKAVQELKIDTSQHPLRELHKLIAVDEVLPFEYFRKLIYQSKIPYKKCHAPGKNIDTGTLLSRLAEIETQKYPASRLARMVGTTRGRLSKIVAEHNIPVYKDRRTQEEMAPLWEKLHSIDTTRYTSNELLDFLDHKVRKNVLLKHLAKRGMKYKLLNGNKV